MFCMGSHFGGSLFDKTCELPLTLVLCGPQRVVSLLTDVELSWLEPLLTVTSTLTVWTRYNRNCGLYKQTGIPARVVKDFNENSCII